MFLLPTSFIAIGFAGGRGGYTYSEVHRKISYLFGFLCGMFFGYWLFTTLLRRRNFILSFPTRLKRRLQLSACSEWTQTRLIWVAYKTTLVLALVCSMVAVKYAIFCTAIALRSLPAPPFLVIPLSWLQISWVDVEKRQFSYKGGAALCLLPANTFGELATDETWKLHRHCIRYGNHYNCRQ